MIQADLNIIMPEIILSLFAMWALLGAVYTSKDKMASDAGLGNGGLFVALALWIGVNGQGTNPAFGGMFVDDAFCAFCQSGDPFVLCGCTGDGPRIHAAHRLAAF